MIDTLRCENLTDNLFATWTDSSVKRSFWGKNISIEQKEIQKAPKKAFLFQNDPESVFMTKFSSFRRIWLKVTRRGLHMLPGYEIVATADVPKLDATTCLSVVGQMYKCITRSPPRDTFGSGSARLPHSELVRLDVYRRISTKSTWIRPAFLGSDF